MTERHTAVVRVLRRVLVLNLAVAAAKIALGYLTGAVSILSDGFHSLTDAASNVVALIGVSAAQRPPDADHPYGHRKYETMASLAILVFMIIVLVQIFETAIGRLRTASMPTVLPASVLMMLATLVVNVLVVRYESKEGRRLNSQILGADAKHTQSDVWTTSAVLAALLGAWLGYPRLDPFAGLVVAVFIGHACWQIARMPPASSRIRSSSRKKTSDRWWNQRLASSGARRFARAARRTTCSSICTSGSTDALRLLTPMRFRTSSKIG